MIDINFFEDPLKAPRAREDVRLNQLALYVHPDGGRRVAVGFDITPFIERPSIDVRVTNARGEPAANLTVIQTLESNFHLTLHLRDKEPTDEYTFSASLYYGGAPDEERMDVHAISATVDVSQPGTELRVP